MIGQDVRDMGSVVFVRLIIRNVGIVRPVVNNLKELFGDTKAL